MSELSGAVKQIPYLHFQARRMLRSSAPHKLGTAKQVGGFKKQVRSLVDLIRQTVQRAFRVGQVEGTVGTSYQGLRSQSMRDLYAASGYIVVLYVYGQLRTVTRCLLLHFFYRQTAARIQRSGNHRTYSILRGFYMVVEFSDESVN